MLEKQTEPQDERQIKFFDILVGNGGEVAAAAKEVGYNRSYAYQLAKKYKTYLLDRVEGHIYIHAVKAAKTLTDTMEDDGTTPNAKLRLNAAVEVLDRSGAVKIDKSEIKVDTPNGIFILPAKSDDKDPS